MNEPIEQKLREHIALLGKSLYACGVKAAQAGIGGCHQPPVRQFGADVAGAAVCQPALVERFAEQGDVFTQLLFDRFVHGSR